MTTRATLLSPIGNVHRVLVQNDGSNATGCGLKLVYGRNVPVRPVQALVYHLQGCQSPECWGTGMWAKFMEGTLR